MKLRPGFNHPSSAGCQRLLGVVGLALLACRTAPPAPGPAKPFLTRLAAEQIAAAEAKLLATAGDLPPSEPAPPDAAQPMRPDAGGRTVDAGLGQAEASRPCIDAERKAPRKLVFTISNQFKADEYRLSIDTLGNVSGENFRGRGPRLRTKTRSSKLDAEHLRRFVALLDALSCDPSQPLSCTPAPVRDVPASTLVLYTVGNDMPIGLFSEHGCVPETIPASVLAMWKFLQPL